MTPIAAFAADPAAERELAVDCWIAIDALRLADAETPAWLASAVNAAPGHWAPSVIARYTQALIGDLQERGEASVVFDELMSAERARSRLQNAARRAGLLTVTRIERTGPATGRVVATVVDADQ